MPEPDTAPDENHHHPCRAGSKVVCLGNLAQIDTPYLSATSSGLTYLTERFKDFPNGVHITLQGVPRSILAEYAESHL